MRRLADKTTRSVRLIVDVDLVHEDETVVSDDEVFAVCENLLGLITDGYSDGRITGDQECVLDGYQRSAAEFLGSYQQQVVAWARGCFGDEVAADIPTRMARFFEEVCEALQSRGFPREWFEQLISRVYSRPPGELRQELGGVMVTLHAWAGAEGINLVEVAEAELARCLRNTPLIREKNLTKPKFGPLPGEYPDGIKPE